MGAQKNRSNANACLAHFVLTVARLTGKRGLKYVGFGSWPSEVRENLPHVHSKDHNAAGQQRATPLHRSFISQKRRHADACQAGDKQPVARSLQPRRIKVRQRLHFAAANVLAVTRIPNQERHNLVKHAQDGERHHAQQTEKAI